MAMAAAAFSLCPVASSSLPLSSRTCIAKPSANVSLQFGVSPSLGRITAKVFKIKFITPEGEKVIEATHDKYILDAGEEAGIDLPYSCRAGACSSCAGKVVDGEIDQSEQSFLDDDQMGNGFVLTCIAYATSDVTIETHCEDKL